MARPIPFPCRRQGLHDAHLGIVESFAYHYGLAPVVPRRVLESETESPMASFFVNNSRVDIAANTPGDTAR